MGRIWSDRMEALRGLFGLMALMIGGRVAEMLFPGVAGWGIVPRTLGGIFPGIAFSPFLHASWGHLLGNLWALGIFGGMLAVIEGERRFWRITLAAIVFGGALTWLIGPRGDHIGASGLVFAYFGYLTARGFATRHPGMAIVSLGVGMLYGLSMLGGILFAPSGVSWAGHLSGLVAGGLLAMTDGKPSR